MGRIIAIDYGKKRTGLAVSDPLRIIASGIGFVPSANLRVFLKEYALQEGFDEIVIGYPISLDGSDTDATKPVRDIIRLLKKDFPKIPVHPVDERYTSKLAVQALIESGVSKSKRKEKGRVDEMAAVLMLRDWMGDR